MSEPVNHFAELAAVNCNDKTETKGKFTYLSWAWAVDVLMRKDPSATWQFHEPQAFGDTLMVSCTVTAFGKPMYMFLPVMDERNQAIKQPTSTHVNKAMMRCLVKAIAVHGLGLYIYAGEDLPEVDPKMAHEEAKASMQEWLDAFEHASTLKALGALWKEMGSSFVQWPDLQGQLTEAKDERKAELMKLEQTA